MNWREEIQYDVDKRKLLGHYHPNLKGVVIRKYLVTGAFQLEN
jgi:hypothetical protein